MLDLRVLRDFEVAHVLHDLVVERRVVLEDLGDRDFLEDRNTQPARFYRIANEVPAVLMLAIVFMVIVKPF